LRRGGRGAQNEPASTRSSRFPRHARSSLDLPIGAPPSERRRPEIGRRPGRVRLIAALLLLAAPLAVAAWGLGGYSAQRERSNADARLAESLNSAGEIYRNLVSAADAAASRLASERRLQLAFLRGGPRVLSWRMRPGGAVVRWRGAVP